MRIDVHAHYRTDEYLDQIAAPMDLASVDTRALAGVREPAAR